MKQSYITHTHTPVVVKGQLEVAAPPHNPRDVANAIAHENHQNGRRHHIGDNHRYAEELGGEKKG